MTDAATPLSSGKGRRAVVFAILAVSIAVIVIAAFVVRQSDSDHSQHGQRDSEGRIVHLQGDGPLTAYVGGGGASLFVPANGGAQWSGSFGSLMPCSSEPGPDILIDGVRSETSPDPLKIGYWFRLSPSVDKRKGDPDEWNPIGMIRGTHGHYGDEAPVRGMFIRTLTSPVNDLCEGEPDPDQERVELITEMTVGKHGGWVHETYIDYHVGDQAYTLVIPWDNIMCGDEITEGDWC